MAGLISRLLGGKPDVNEPATPEPGIGGYTAGPGPFGADGFPGSTKQTRTLRNATPRTAKIRADRDSGFEQGLSSTQQARRASYRGDVPGSATRNPYDTPVVSTSQPEATVILQDVPGEFYGGPMLKTGPGNDTAGGYINREGAQRMGLPGADSRDTTTPWVDANVIISGGVPGAQNVRNTVAQRYKYPAGTVHTYKSAPRADTAPVNRGGWATDGNVHPERVVQDVTVEGRALVPDNGGNFGWSILRQMPYTGRGDGARGADLNGQRRYATGQDTQFWNAGQGDYGVARQRGNKRPVSFQQPAPWSSNVYDTTESVGTNDNPNQNPGQQPQAVYQSPAAGRASNGTQRG